MSPLSRTEYISAGGNRHSAAADWSSYSNIVAYGADQNVAVWCPTNERHAGVFALLNGHHAKVTAICFSKPYDFHEDETIVSGDAEGYLRIDKVPVENNTWACITQTQAHKGAINCISCLEPSAVFITGGADALIKVWRRRDNDLDLLSSIKAHPGFIPLSLVIGWFNKSKRHDAAFIAAAGTRNDIQVYSIERLPEKPEVKHCATLTGHEGWIRSLALTQGSDECYMLASASADKYVRLWKFTEGASVSTKAVADAIETGVHQATLTPKLQMVSCSDSKYTITFEALLLGHEDWIYSASWNPMPGKPQLLTASADGSLTIWEPDPASGVWYSASRLGEISGQKGATTATGSSGGFWNGLWSPNGTAITCLGRTGSWRLWSYDQDSQYWVQQTAVSGHINSVNDIAWSSDGSYLLSTSSDQTTRLHAEWKRGTKRTWHEFARPQIHGYDLNCLSSTKPTQFVSGADEKLLRVFNEPKAVANMLQRSCDIEPSQDDSLPKTAAIPVLGLSNKAEADADDSETNGDASDPAMNGTASLLDILATPPTEDILSRHTLFPEHEKLYGHGYEISTSAASSHVNIVATACKASSLEHAVIRLYDTTNWREIKPPLTAHTLTATRLTWSRSPEDYLLSVGRDRQWSVFERIADTQEWQLKQSNAKAHTRMILDCAWSPIGGYPFFATAGRDKVIKIWSRQTINVDGHTKVGDLKLALDIKRKNAVTAVDFTCDEPKGLAILAAGEENGTISVHVLDIGGGRDEVIKSVDLPREACPSKAVNRLAWRTDWLSHGGRDEGVYLGVASADSSVRVVRINLDELTRGTSQIMWNGAREGLR